MGKKMNKKILEDRGKLAVSSVEREVKDDPPLAWAIGGVVY